MVRRFLARLLGRTESDTDFESEKTEQETRTITHNFPLYRATITYPDGESERVEYTNADYPASEIVLYDHDADDYTARTRRPRYTSGYVILEAEHSKPRRFSLANIRDMNIERTTEMTAVAEVDVTVSYKRYSEGDDWAQSAITLDSGGDAPDVKVWYRTEWEADNE